MKTKLLLVFNNTFGAPQGVMAQIITLDTVKSAKKLADDFMRGNTEDWIAYGEKIYSSFRIDAEFFHEPLADDILAYMIYRDNKLIDSEFFDTATAIDFITNYLPEIAGIELA